jgi:tetratricopeptide (TPR) repeat protein
LDDPVPVSRSGASVDPDGSKPWRVFVSYTRELADFPATQSYVAAVKAAISATGHVVVDMAECGPIDTAPAATCVEMVRGCDVFVAILGARHSPPVADRPEVSYTELEFDTATDSALDRLAFLLEPGAAATISPETSADQENQKADRFRQRVKGSVLRTAPFASPEQLSQLVRRSLEQLAATRARIEDGIEHVRRPGESPPWESKLVNPLPAREPAWFADRDRQTQLLIDFLTDPHLRLLTVTGRGGNGKTALVCRLLRGPAAGALPGSNPPDLGGVTADDIIYLSPNGRHTLSYQNLVGDLARVLPSEIAKEIQRLYQNPANTPAQVMSALLEKFAPGIAVVVFLDNLESVLDTSAGCLRDRALHEALVTVLTSAQPTVKVIVATRVTPTELRSVRPAAQQQLPLDDGLGTPYAENVLRALDSDGCLGLRDAPVEVLSSVREQTRGFPRALEAILATDPTLNLTDVLDAVADVGPDQIIEVLVAKAYDHLDRPAQHVLQALAVYPTPVFPVGVDFLLQPYIPTVNTAPILGRMARRELARSDGEQYYLRPVDRAYILGRIPAGAPGDAPPAYTLTALRVRAAEYYAQIRRPPATWSSLDDIRPQLVEFDLRCDAGEFDTAATILADIDTDYLQVWGHYRTLIDLHARIHLKISNPDLQAGHLSNFGIAHFTLGDYPMAISLYEDALRIARETGNLRGQANELVHLGNCHFNAKDYPMAIGLYEEALRIDEAVGHLAGQANDLGNLGDCHFSLGDSRKAIGLHEDALRIDRTTGNRPGQCADLGNLGLAHFALGHFQKAADLHQEALHIATQIGDAQSQADQLGNLGLAHFALGDYQKAADLHQEALHIATQIGDAQSQADQLGNLGNCHFSLGDYDKAIELYEQALSIDHQGGRRKDEARTLANLGSCHYALGDYTRAISLYEQALGIDQRIGRRRGEADDLGDLGLAHYRLGDYPKAINLALGALAIVRQIGNRQGEADQLGNLGNAHFALGDYQEATALHEVALRIAREISDHYLQATSAIYLARVNLACGEAGPAVSLLQEAIRIADTAGDIEPRVQARSTLARARLLEGQPVPALALTGQARDLNYPTEQASLWLLEAIALLHLGRAGAHQSFQAALAEAERMLAMASSNVDALHERALACAGLVVTGDPDRAGEAAQMFTQARAVTAAAGVTAEVAALLEVLAGRDNQGLLAQCRAALHTENGQPEASDR